ncbi:MAG: hypothetical protein PVF83_03670 [Anaerolineales bacterium]|jgi:hypothetical protein
MVEKDNPIRKKIKISLFVIIAFSALCTTPLYLNTLLIHSRNFLATRTKQFDSPEPQFLYKFPSDGHYYDKFFWEDGSSLIKIQIHNYDAPDTIEYFNLETNEIIYQEEEVSLNPDDGPLPEQLLHLGFDDETISWALCPDRNLLVAAGDFGEEQQWLKL